METTEDMEKHRKRSRACIEAIEDIVAKEGGWPSEEIGAAFDGFLDGVALQVETYLNGLPLFNGKPSAVVSHSGLVDVNKDGSWEYELGVSRSDNPAEFWSTTLYSDYDAVDHVKSHMASLQEAADESVKLKKRPPPHA